MAWFLLTKNVVQLLNCTVNVAFGAQAIDTMCRNNFWRSVSFCSFTFLRKITSIFYIKICKFIVKALVYKDMNKNDPSKTISILYALEPELCCSASDQAILVLAGLE